jgi:hypothetical protein
MVNLRASFDKAREKIRQATSKSTTLKLKGYSEMKVRSSLVSLCIHVTRRNTGRMTTAHHPCPIADANAPHS